MADYVVSDNESIILHINNDSGADNSPPDDVRVQKFQSSPVELLTLSEPPKIKLTGRIERGDTIVLDNDATGSTGTIAQLAKGNTVRGEIAYETGEARLQTLGANDDDITLRSASDVVVWLDVDDDAANARFQFRNHDGTNDHLSVYEDGDLTLFDGDITVAKDGNDVVVVVGTGTGAKGAVDLAAPGGSPARASVLVLETAAGTPWWLWVDGNGLLRIHSADPGSDDTLGTAVRDQTA